MNVCAVQPAYPHTPAEVPAYERFLLETLERMDSRVDLVLLPECCNAPTAYAGDADMLEAVRLYTPGLLQAARGAAVRCGALVAVNLYTEAGGRLRNSTLVFDPRGEIAARYDKRHLPASERQHGVDDSHARVYSPPYVAEIDGVRYGFLTCYDCYYDEYIAHLAAQRVDVLLVPAYQRGERRDMLEAMAKNTAFKCNAYLVRASVSMGDDTCPCGGGTMAVAPDGTVLGSLGQRTGTLTCAFDPKRKHVRPDGFGQPPVPNDLYIGKGRMPWLYRACGPSLRPDDAHMRYPRVCAHRGFNTLAPENTMPAFGAAVALGADELELDIWPTRDHRLVVCHDRTVDRTSDGHGAIQEMTWDEVCRLNIGAKYAPEFDGLRFPLLEDVLRQFARQAVLNLHIKSSARAQAYDEEDFERIAALIRAYDCQDHAYIAGEEDVLRTASRLAPELPRAALDGRQDFTLIDLALEYGCRKAQLIHYDDGTRPHAFNQAMIDRARKHGIRLNVFWCDDPARAVGLLERGVDTILTNDFLRVWNAVERWRNARAQA